MEVKRNKEERADKITVRGRRVEQPCGRRSEIRRRQRRIGANRERERERERENVCVFVRIWSGGKNRREIDKGRGVPKLGLPLIIIMGIEPRKTKSPLTQQGLANK